MLSTNIYSQSCSYAGEGPCGQGLQNPTQLAYNIVSSTCKILNIPNIPVYSGQVENACASMIYGRPAITYGADFMNYLESRNPWAPVSVLAHEVGHHLNMDISWYGQFQHPWSKELKADFVSGYVLAKMGCTLQNAQAAFSINVNWIGTQSHPDTPRRMLALAQGYQRALNGF